MNMQESWYAVVNPSSANGKTKKQWPNHYQKIVESGIELEYAFTSYSGEGAELARQALEKGYRKIIAVGGDGTVNEVLNGLIAEDKPYAADVEFAVLEQGTGGDFVRTIKSGKEIDSLIRLMKGDHFVQADIVRVDFDNFQGSNETRYYLNAANLGVGAEVVDRVNKRGKVLGSKLSYLTGTISAILSYKNFPAVLELDGDRKVEGVFCGLMICNGEYIGGGMHIAPQAKIDDGVLDLILIKNISKLRLLRRFPLIYSGKHIHLPETEIEILRCKTISMITPSSMILETDGEIPGTSPQTFTVIPGCLRIRV